MDQCGPVWVGVYGLIRLGVGQCCSVRVSVGECLWSNMAWCGSVLISLGGRAHSTFFCQGVLKKLEKNLDLIGKKS